MQLGHLPLDVKQLQVYADHCNQNQIVLLWKYLINVVPQQNIFVVKQKYQNLVNANLKEKHFIMDNKCYQQNFHVTHAVAIKNSRIPMLE